VRARDHDVSEEEESVESPGDAKSSGEFRAYDECVMDPENDSDDDKKPNGGEDREDGGKVCEEDER